MATVTKKTRLSRFLLDGVSWQEYTRLLRAFQERPSIRLTYDRGRLEIMTVSFEHEHYSWLLGRLAIALTEELGLPIMGGGSTTFRRYAKRRGLEPDNCYWITSEPKVRGKLKIDIRSDPVPDLAIEIDISRSSKRRMCIYASLRVPEVWRFDGRALSFHILRSNETYEETTESGIFRGLRADDLLRFLTQRGREDENTIIRRFRAWIRTRENAGWR
jgi:Uma2 family endonuclease